MTVKERLVEKFAVPVAVAGALALSAGFGQLFLTVENLERDSVPRQDFSARDREVDAALAVLRESISRVKDHVDRLTKDLDLLEAQFRQHERLRDAHHGD